MRKLTFLIFGILLCSAVVAQKTAVKNNATVGTTNQIDQKSQESIWTTTIDDSKETAVTAKVELSEPVVTLAITNSSCSGANNGSITANATTPCGDGFTYAWSNGATTQTISNLAPGIYTVVVTHTSGCGSSLPTSGTVVELPGFTLNLDSTNVTCNRENNGTATAVLTNIGDGPISYLWSNGSTNGSITGLSPGSYSVIVTQGACSRNKSVNITEPSEIIVTTSSTNTTCGNNNGSATANVSGGVGNYHYAWSNGQTSATVTGLAAGTYTVNVMDGNDCTKTVSVTIGSTSAIIVNTNSTNVLCNAGNTGSATATASNGTAPYQFTWSNGATTATINNLTAGGYSVLVTDAIGCSTTRNLVITQPTALIIGATSTPVSCNGGNNGTATVTGSGGAAGYTYSWSTGGTTQTITNLIAGNYSVALTDANGCTANTSISVSQPQPLISSITSSHITCNGGNNGAATIAPTGGTAPYTYLWINGATTATINNLIAGTYTVIITDSRGCTATNSVTITQPNSITLTPTTTAVSCNGGNNGAVTIAATGGTGAYQILWNTGATTATINNLIAGNYSVVVTDANGCTKTTNVSVTQPAALVASVSAINVSCNAGSNGTATVLATGGTSPYQYTWNNGATTATAVNLVAGNYTVVITDANGCTRTGAVVVTQPTPVLVATSLTSINCFGGNNGTATAIVTGGLSPYQFLWSNGTTTATANNLSAGVYNINVTDANGCVKTATVTLINPALISVNLGPDKTLCLNQTHIANGSLAPIAATYEWTSTNGFTSTSAAPNLSQASTYFLKATTSLGCIARDTIVITTLTNKISSDFVVASQVFKNRTITIVNIAEPKPDVIEWILPSSSSVITQSNSQARLELLVSDTGTYRIGMRSRLGQCESITNKDIYVLNPQTFDTTIRVQDPLIKLFTIAPNPSSGQFTVKVDLREITGIRLRLLNTVTNLVVNDRAANGFNSYTIPYNINVPRGMYVLVLETPKATRVHKIVIN